MAEISFKVSSGLKNIIGKELITDDFIAVFELVKNSFDANARKVEITFNDLNSETPCITIKDDGDGMDDDDLENKWLFVAYSAKKSEEDYRDKIKSSRVYAGAKGIGRFSCDRLGAKLRLITRKKATKSPYYILNMDWSRFEIDPKEEFQTIPAQLTETNRSPVPPFESGTILEISNLRSKDWDRDKLLKLRRSLERLINPNQDNDADNFSVILKAPDQQQADEAIKAKTPDEPWNIVNGPIKNFIFEALELKTTQIQLEIGKQGNTLITELRDRGTLIYELLENNPYQNILKNIKIKLFFLNKSAKLTFARRMGLPSVQYGSVFVYRNGFRIHPYGDARTDSLGLDRRKQQGYNRFLGSRELIGRIEINSDDPYYFQETSSRDGGFIKDIAFENLIKLLFKYALPRLENYVIELVKFGKGLEDLPDINNPNSKELRKIVFDIVTKLTRSKDVIDIHYDPDVLDILENRSAESVTALLNNLKRISVDQNDNELYKEISKAEKQVKTLKKAKEEAEKETEKERERTRQAEKEAREAYAQAQKAEKETLKAQEETRKVQQQVQDSKVEVEALSTQNIFLKSALSKDLEHVLELHHSIKQDAINIDDYTSYLLSVLNNEKKELKPERLRATLERISFIARKIMTTSRFATQANFKVDAEEITVDLIEYIREYLLNIYGGSIDDIYGQNIDISFTQPDEAEFIAQFQPINVSIIFDNLISNSRKNKAKAIEVNLVEQTNDKLVVSFRDNGKGVARKNVPFLFDIGFTTTDGSGLGLHNSRTIMEEMSGSITFNENYKEGAEFILTFNRKKLAHEN